VWIVVAVLLLFLSLPYAWAAGIAAPGFEYSGLLYNPDDQNVHLAWARQARDGQFFFKDPFTHESLGNQRPLFTNVFSAASCWSRFPAARAGCNRCFQDAPSSTDRMARS
jgi:hypothetical protein